jgi:hypothetical protein
MKDQVSEECINQNGANVPWADDYDVSEEGDAGER